MRLAIVGSTKFKDPQAMERAENLIRATLDKHNPEAVISGGAPGIDNLAARVATELGYSKGNLEHDLIEHLPQTNDWANGFKPRNTLIAEQCTHLIRIACRESKTYGSGWTADLAEKLGKPVHRVEF